MKIEAIVVCVDYADYLAETLPHNIPHFDRILVITSEQDTETQELCRRMSVPYYATDIFYHQGAKFNKARGIDFGIGYTRWNDWLVQLDADMVLPPVTRNWLETRKMDAECIYGIDRVHVTGADAWDRFSLEHRMGHDYMCRVHVPGGGRFPIGDRIAIKDYGGYVPIGYFQMWNGKHGRRYPIAKGDAEHTDVLHAIQWADTKRLLIPEIIGYHLLAEPTPLGTNWQGRKSARFRRRSAGSLQAGGLTAPPDAGVASHVKPVIYQ